MVHQLSRNHAQRKKPITGTIYDTVRLLTSVWDRKKHQALSADIVSVSIYTDLLFVPANQLPALTLGRTEVEVVKWVSVLPSTEGTIVQELATWVFREANRPELSLWSRQVGV